MNESPKVELPELPYTDLMLSAGDGEPFGKGFSEDDMRSYATAAVLAERLRAAKIAEGFIDHEWPSDDMSVQCENIAAAIRKG